MFFSEFDTMDWKTIEAEQFATYWRTLSNLGGLPYKSDFDPASIPLLLPNISIYEIRDNEDVYCRLMGTGLAESFGHDFTGQSILQWWPDERREDFITTLRKMSGQPCGVLTHTQAHTKSGMVLSGSSVGFPALDSGGRANIFVFYTTNIVGAGRRYPREDRVLSVDVIEQVMVSLA